MPQEQEENRNELGQWQKGISGNPGGRPKGSVGLNKRIRELLLSEGGADGKTVADVLVEVLVKAALKNPAKMWPFIREIMDRDEGPVNRTAGPMVSIDMGGTVPQPPPLEGSEDGTPPLGEHLSRIFAIAKERGIALGFSGEEAEEAQLEPIDKESE